MPAGLLLVVAGAIVLSQVLGGNALGRLGVSGEADHDPTDPITGAPTGPRKPGTNFEGRPL